MYYFSVEKNNNNFMKKNKINMYKLTRHLRRRCKEGGDGEQQQHVPKHLVKVCRVQNSKILEFEHEKRVGKIQRENMGKHEKIDEAKKFRKFEINRGIRKIKETREKKR